MKQTDKPKFKIEKGVKIPLSRGGSLETRYPWATLKKGESFLVALNGKTCKAVQNSLSTCSHQQAKRHGTKYTTRQMDGGVRVWRVK